MAMYSYQIPEDKKDMYACSRAEDVEASYKDLTQVCGRIRNKNAAWAISFLEEAASGLVPILYKKYNRHLGHRHELNGSRGRYPVKAALVVLKALKSAIANSTVKGLSEELIVVHASANKRFTYPRLSPKGRRFKQNYEISRVEIVVKEKVETSADVKKARAEKAKKKVTPKTADTTKPAEAVPATKEHDHSHPHEHKHEAEAKPAAEKKPRAKKPSATKSDERKSE